MFLFSSSIVTVFITLDHIQANVCSRGCYISTSNLCIVAELIPYPYPHPLLLVFWLLAILSVAGVIFAYGAEFVSYPRLNQRQFDKEKIL